MNEQRLHPDSQTQLPETDYFFIGSGTLQVALQWSRHPGSTPLGLIISRPDQFVRKWGSHLFHPELGLERTMVTVIIDGVRYKPTVSTLQVHHTEHEGVPNIYAIWMAGEHEVTESFWISPGSSALIRWVRVRNAANKHVEVETSLYANPNLFSSFGSRDSFLYAAGYSVIYLATRQPSVISERFITITAEPFLATDKEVHLVYAEGNVHEVKIDEMFEQECAYWAKASSVRSSTLPQIEAQFRKSNLGLRSVIASNGKFDASIWQYGMQWGRDAAKVAEGLVYGGQFELARAVLHHALSALCNEEGMVAEASRFRGGKHSELDSNGLLLTGLHTYFEWTGDESLIKEQWTKITAIADYLLRSEFFGPPGLLVAARDIWERMEAMGIEPGYDIAHQTFAITGLRAIASLANYLGETEKSIKYEEAGLAIEEAFLRHPTHSMLEEGRFIKRRLIDGSIQNQLTLNKKKEREDFFASFTPDSMPLAANTEHLLEPDVASLFPILSGLIDPQRAEAKATFEFMKSLWSQAWEEGGCGRYDISGEPDSPGPWSLATIFYAQAAVKCGYLKEANEALEWLHHKAGAGGAWFEFYGERPTPPLPPVGILVWSWAEYQTLIVRDMLGAKVKNGQLTFTPAVPGITATIRFRERRIECD